MGNTRSHFSSRIGTATTRPPLPLSPAGGLNIARLPTLAAAVDVEDAALGLPSARCGGFGLCNGVLSNERSAHDASPRAPPAPTPPSSMLPASLATAAPVPPPLPAPSLRCLDRSYAC